MDGNEDGGARRREGLDCTEREDLQQALIWRCNVVVMMLQVNNNRTRPCRFKKAGQHSR